MIEDDTVVIINPAASSGGAAERWPGIHHALQRRFARLKVRKTERRGHATELCRQALEEGAEMILSVGGDGTNNEVLCGFMDAEGRNRFPQAILGIIAAGTGGDFQRQFGVVTPQRQVERLCGASPRTIDYGIARLVGHDGEEVVRPFLNTASVGVSGLVVDYVDSASRALGSTGAYVMSSLKGIANWRNQQVVMRVDDGDPERLDLTLLVVGNGQYFGAGMWACPHAALDDGEFDVVDVRGMSKRKLLYTLTRVFQGKHLRIDGVRHRHARKVSIDPVGTASRLLIEIDGEQPGMAPASFEIVPRGLRIRVA